MAPKAAAANASCKAANLIAYFRAIRPSTIFSRKIRVEHELTNIKIFLVMNFEKSEILNISLNLFIDL